MAFGANPGSGAVSVLFSKKGSVCTGQRKVVGARAAGCWAYHEDETWKTISLKVWVSFLGALTFDGDTFSLVKHPKRSPYCG